MSLRGPWLRPLTFSAFLTLAACSPTKPSETPVAQEIAKAPAPLKAEEFAPELATYLSGPTDEAAGLERAVRLCRFQLVRAQELFRQGYRQAGAETARGALYLLQGRLRTELALQGLAEPLLLTGHAAAQKGDAASAQALYGLAVQLTSDASEQKELREHLEALEKFERDTRSGEALLMAGEAARASLVRAYTLPDPQEVEAARQAIIVWMQTALMMGQPKDGGGLMERELSMEAYRAVRGGAPALIALGLRDSKLEASMKALDDAGLGRTLQPGLRIRVDAARTGSGEAWLDLYRYFDAARRDPEADLGLPSTVLEAAAYRAGLEHYRAGGKDPGHLMPLSLALVELGMPEGAAAIFAKEMGPETPPAAVTWSLSLLARALLTLSDTNQLTAARATFQAAEPVLKLAESPGFEATRPAPSRLRSLLATLEIRAGELDSALVHLEEANQRDPLTDTLLRESQLHAALGNASRALSSAGKAQLLAEQTSDLFAESAAHEQAYLLLRVSAPAEAQEHLKTALARIVTLRGIAPENVPAPALERQLAHLLEYYQQKAAVHAAYERALQKSKNLPLEMQVTLTDMARSALTSGDLELGRRALREAMEANLEASDLVYIVLWVQQLELNLKQTDPALMARAKSKLSGEPGWTNSLLRFSEAQLSGEDLEKSATRLSEQVEAHFYRVMASPAGEAKQKELLELAKSRALDLIEVRIARDLSYRGEVYPLPSEAKLP